VEYGRCGDVCWGCTPLCGVRVRKLTPTKCERCVIGIGDVFPCVVCGRVMHVPTECGCCEYGGGKSSTTVIRCLLLIDVYQLLP